MTLIHLMAVVSFWHLGLSDRNSIELEVPPEQYTPGVRQRDLLHVFTHHNFDEQLSNRVCPEYGGVFSATVFPEGARPACVVEGDILCPHYKPSRCRGGFPLNCSAPSGDTRVRPRFENKPFITGDMLAYDYAWMVEVRIDREFSKDAFLSILRILHLLESHVCLKHIILRTDDWDPLSIRPYIRFIPSACLCAVDGLGSPDIKKFPEGTTPYRAIYVPDYMLDENRLNLSVLYDSDTVRMPAYHGFDPNNKGPSFAVCSMKPGVKLHLYFHALGFGHENNRPDRDRFIHVNKRQIMRDTGNNMHISHFFRTDNYDNPLFTKYDKTEFQHESLMQYDIYSWNAMRDIPVISPITLLEPYKFGNREVLTTKELRRLKAIFRPRSSLGKCRRTEPTFFARSRRRCSEAPETESTARLGSSKHFGAKVEYKCRRRDHIMLGSSLRQCTRTTKWSGFTPACVDHRSLRLYCQDGDTSKKCRFMRQKSHEHMDNPENTFFSSMRFKRNIPHDPLDEKYFVEIYTTPFIKFRSEKICVQFYYQFGRFVPVEVFLVDSSGSRTKVWKDISTNKVFDDHMVLFETTVSPKRESYQLEFRGIDAGSDSPLPLEMKYVAVVDGKCFKM